MATQEQLAALQKILNIANNAGLNKQEEKDSVGTPDEFNKKLDEITKNNTEATFLMYCNIDNIEEINQKYSKVVSLTICNNVLSAIQSVARQEFSKYNLLIYKIAANKTSLLISLKDNNKTENIMTIKNISTSIETMISVSCGTKSKISISVAKRKDNENKDSLISRTDLLLRKKDCIIAYDSEYFQATNSNDNLFTDTAFNVSGNEIISLYVGGAGTNIGNEFYKLIMNEHKIECKTGEFTGDLNDNMDNILLDKINTYFNYKKDKYSPRAVFIDLDMENLNKLKTGYLNSLVDIDSFCGYSGDTKIDKLLWPQGYYTMGKEIFDNVKNVVRSTAELCDNMQGFNICHSINGGVGGGLTSLLQSALRDDYPDKIFANFCIYPNSDNVNENYNSLLTLNSLRTKTDLIFPINNTKLNEIAIKKLNLDKENIKYSDYNWLISLVLSGVTSGFRYYGEPELISSLRKMYMSFALHAGATHLSMSHSPFINNNKPKMELNASQVKSELLSSINNISFYHKSNKIDMINSGKIIQLMTIYKSNNDTIINDLDNKLRHLTQELYDSKLQIDPMPFQSSVIYKQCSYYNKYTPLISTSIIHSTEILKIYKNMKTVFKKNFDQKKMLSQYYDHGMDSYEFIEADKNIKQLIEKYKKYQDSKLADSDEEEKDDDDDDGDDDGDDDEEEEDDDDY